MKLLVPTGYFDAGGDGCLWGVDLAVGRADLLLRYTPPEHLRVPTRGFTGGCWAPEMDSLYLAGHAAVFHVDARRWVVDGVLHLPSFNDLHHVAARGGRLYVANTGSDAIDVFGLDGHFLGSHSLVPGWVLARRMTGAAPPRSAAVEENRWDAEAAAGWTLTADDDGYHTPIAAREQTPYWRAKLPDRWHPNHVCLVGDDLLATCLNDGSIRDVRSFKVVMRVPELYPHDGLHREGALWFTSIDGGVWRLPWPTQGAGPERVLDVFSRTGHHGWCRGLWMDEDSFAVGLTEVRADRLPRHRWSEREPRGSETSVLWIDRRTGDLLGRVVLTDHARHSKLYSLLPWDGR